ncbi:MAG: 4-hydroxybenzoyl-CoA reductase subunit beta [Bacteroidia bacterium]|nr:4-hydroxybenzoyl-CoA reductase subunit beta [Bacteroidia bacterium]
MITQKLYLKPKSLDEALKSASENENNFRFLAGGTDILVNKFQGNDAADCLIDISGIEELRQITKSENYLSIGSLVKLDELQSHSEICKEFPVLIEAAKAVASPMIRKTATLGGNLLCENRCSFYNQSEWWREAVGYCLKCDGAICIATGGRKNCFSKFVSDTAVALVSMDATIDIADIKGSYTVKLEDIYSGNGVNPRNLDKLALIISINLPMSQNYKSVFKKLRQRESLEFSSLSTAVTLNSKGKIKIVLGGVDPKPVVEEGTTNENIEDLITKITKKARIVDNDVYSREYRKEMIGSFLRKSFKILLD